MDKSKRSGILCLFALVCVAILLSTSLMFFAGNNNEPSTDSNGYSGYESFSSDELVSCTSKNADGKIVATYDATNEFVGEKEMLGERTPTNKEFDACRLTFKILDGDKLSIVDYDGSYRNIVVPDEVDYKGKLMPVTEIDEWGLSTGPFGRHPHTVEIGPLMETLCAHSINGQWCSSDGLREFTIRDIKESRLTTIGDYAFYGTFITSIDLPKSLKVIGEQAFYNCTLKKVNLRSETLEIGTAAFSQNPLFNINLEKVRYIGDHAFYKTNLTTVDLRSATEIGENAFGCNELYCVKFSSELTSLHKNAFVTRGDHPYHFFDIYHSEYEICAENMCGKKFQWWGESLNLIECII